MKRMRKITALLLATVMVAGSGSVPNNLTSVKAAEAESSSADLSNYLTVYEDFDMEGYEYGTASYYDLEPDDSGKAKESGPNIVERTGGGKWAEYTKKTGLGYGYRHPDKVNAAIEEYDGFAAYVKADTAVTFNFVLKGEYGLSRTCSNQYLEYVLITKNGKKSTGTGNCGIPIVEGFEGWVIVKKEAMTVAPGWTVQGVKKDAFYNINNYSRIFAFTPELSSFADEKSVYVDDFSFVKNCDSFISYMAPPSVYDYLNVYEDFESYDSGKTYLMDYEDKAFGTSTEVTVLDRNLTGNKWLKYEGNNFGGHCYVEDTGDGRTNISGRPEDYNGFTAYIHTEKGVTFNVRFQGPGGSCMTRTATNSALPYTLISKDGKKTTGVGKYGIPVPAGFEGWIIMATEDFTAATNWDEAWKKIAETPYWNDIAYLNRMAVELTNSTAPVYVDDISFVTNTEDMINYLAPDKATAEDYLVVYEDFDSYDLESDFKLDQKVGNSSAKAKIKKKKGKDRWLYLSGNSEEYHYYEGGKSNITLGIDDAKGFAYYVKTKSSATLNFLMRGGAHGVSNTMTNDTLSYTLISADGKVSKGSNANGIPVSAGFEGWVVIEKDQLTPARGYDGNPSSPATSAYHDAFDGTTNVSQITGFAPEITDATDAVYVDNLSFVTNVDAFVNALKVDRPSHFVKYYETFDSYEVGKDSYNWNSFDFGDTYKATTTIEQKGLTDKWLRLNGSNMSGYIYGRAGDGSANRGWPYTGIQGKVSDYEGISLEVKTEFATTLNIRLGAHVAGTNYLVRTAMNDEFSYQLIDTKGKITAKKTAGGIVLPAGFEGTVVFKKSQAVPHTNYSTMWDKFEGNNDNLSLITEFSPEVQTEGAIYLDNYAFVTDVDKYVASFKNQTYTYGTGDMNEDGIVDDYDVMLARKYLVTNNTKMLNLDGKNEMGFAVSDQDNQKDIKSYDSFAIYVKTDSTVALNMAIRYTYIVQEEVDGESKAEQKIGLVRTGIQDLSWNQASIKYSLLSVNGTKLEKETTGKMEVPAGFEGWILFGLDEFKRNDGYKDLTTMKDVTTDVNFQNVSPMIVEANEKVDFNIAQIALVRNKTHMIETWENGKSVAGYLNTIEDFESQPSGKFVLNFKDTGTGSANAKITKFGKFAQSSYDYNKDNKIGSADIVRLKKMAADMIEESGISLDNELVQNTSVWNTPGLAENKDFQFDVEADSTWTSVTTDRDWYLNSLNYHGVGETESLLPTKRAAEWGYSMSKLIGKTDGSGTDINFKYDTPLTNEAAVAQMKSFIQQVYNIAEGEEWFSMNGYYPWYHYAADFGASVVATEIGENVNNYQMHTAFLRGAGRQYHLPWVVDFSMWHKGEMYNPNGYSGWGSKSENTGHSLSLLERSLVAGYMSGANSVVPEAGGAMSLYGEDKDKDGYLDLTKYGETIRKVYQFTEQTDRGTAYTPVGIVLNYYHGSYAKIESTSLFSQDEGEYRFGEGVKKSPSSTFKYSAGDTMTKNLMDKIWGTSKISAWLSGSSRGSEKEVAAMVNNSAYGDSFDILLDNASLATLKSYPVLVLSGAFTGEDELTTEQIQMYKQYVNDGGTLILNKAYTTIFPEFTESMPYGDGEVIVYGEKDYDLTGIEEILKTQIAKYQPVNVTAGRNDIQYMTSMKDNKLYVTLINNAGVTKEGEKAAVVEESMTSTVTVQYTGTYNVTSVADVYNNYDVTQSASEATVTVPAGSIAVLEFNLDS